MRVAVNQQPYAGPWGGGNRFIGSLCEGLQRAGHEVAHALSGDVDVILICETRARSPNVTFGAGAVLRYLLRHPRTVVVQRINECDERKGGEKFITHRLLRANYAADFTVFVGSWLMDLPAWRGHDRSRCSVILNGADPEIFNPDGGAVWNGQEPLRLVTHHWGAHPYKGFDVYHALDKKLDDPDFSKITAMTYIGNTGTNPPFRNIRVIAPLNGKELADAIKGHHVYLTGSMNEPGGNHQNEGACCGLPLVYRRSGCLPEYCDGFGAGFDGPDDVVSALDSVRRAYPDLRAKMPSYPHIAPKTVEQWLDLFATVVAQRDQVVAKRRLWRDPCAFMINQIPL